VWWACLFHSTHRPPPIDSGRADRADRVDRVKLSVKRKVPRLVTSSPATTRHAPRCAVMACKEHLLEVSIATLRSTPKCHSICTLSWA
jgi:hypothetical protein